MAKIYIYDTHEIDRKVLENGLQGHELTFFTETLSKENTSPETEILSVFVSSYVPREVFELMPNLKLIACRSTGFNNIDLAYAEEIGIPVVNVPSYGENTVAEYTFALLLALTRKVNDSTKLTKENVCINPDFYTGIDICQKTLGVLGTGKIGKKVIAIAKGFEMNVIAYDPFKDEQYTKDHGFTYESFEEVMKRADILTLHMPLTEETKHIIKKESLDLTKDEVLIVNTARGELIDTRDLVNALEENKVAGVALDVCEGEDLLKKVCRIPEKHDSHTYSMLEESLEISVLKSMPNVILSPHLAYNTKEAITRINETTIANIRAFLQNNIVNKVASAVKATGKLILVRHSESEWNEKGMWTGTRDVKLTLKGFQDARVLGEALRDLKVDQAFASEQIRTMETLSSMLGSMSQPMVPVIRDKALNERDYGDYTGKNKHDMKELLGDEKFEAVRRGYDVEVPNGETLKDVYERIVPYYLATIVPLLLQGQNVLIVSHGNALRALMKYIEKISDEDIAHTEMMFGGALLYAIDKDGYSTKKEIRETPALTLDTHV